MIEILSGVVEALQKLGDGSAQQGMYALGWVLAGIFGYVVFSKRGKVDEQIAQLQKDNKEEAKLVSERHQRALDDERAARQAAREKSEDELRVLRSAYEAEIARIRADADARIKETEDDLSERLDEALDQIQSLNQAHIQAITDLSDKRVEDFKSVNEDYNKMVDQVRLALEKIAGSIGKKR